MRRAFFHIIVLIFVQLFCMITPLRSTTRFVAHGYPKGLCHENLADAVDQASAGDTIIIAPGSYLAANTVIDKAVLITGLDRDSVTLQLAAPEGAILILRADSCRLENLTFEIEGLTGLASIGIYVSDVQLDVKDCQFIVNSGRTLCTATARPRSGNEPEQGSTTPKGSSRPGCTKSMKGRTGKSRISCSVISLQGGYPITHAYR